MSETSVVKEGMGNETRTKNKERGNLPSAHKLLPSKLFSEIILSGNPNNYRN